MDKKINKKGQVAIWIIIAVIFVGSVILFLLLSKKPSLSGQETPGFDAGNYVEQCIERITEDALDDMLVQGGSIAPENCINYYGNCVEYICENAGFYEPCVQQHPLLIQEMKMDLQRYILGQIDSVCFASLGNEVAERNGKCEGCSSGDTTIAVKMREDNVYVNVNRTIRITEKEQTREYNYYEVDIKSPAFNLASLALEIASQESEYCYFEYIGYNLYYPRYLIKPYQMSEPVKVYNITDKESGKFMLIATRSCAIPAGM